MIRMMLILLDQLNILHSNKIGIFLHRDIKSDNIMYYYKNNEIYFVFIDFGSSSYLNDKNKIKSETKPFTAPEQNTDNESEKSDIYSLGKTFEIFIKEKKLEVSESIKILIQNLILQDYNERPSCKQVIDCLIQICTEKKYTDIDIYNFIIEKKPFIQPHFN